MQARVMRKTPVLLMAAACLLATGLASAAPEALREKARQAKSVKELFAMFGADSPEPGKRVLLEVPDIVDGGAKVPVKVTSHIAGTDWIIVLADRNLAPYVMDEEFSPGQERSLSTQVDLAQTSRVRVLVRASGKFYQVVREVKVATPDCTQP